MTKYVALLRGINVGGNSKVEMSKLKKCFESFGYQNVFTYINSGNIIYDSKKSLDLLTKNSKVDNLKYIDGAIVWNIKRGDYSKSGMNKLIGTPLYKHMTARNINTVRKLDALMNTGSD